MKKSAGLTFASLMFSAGSAVAADYKIDKVSTPLLISASSTLAIAGYTAPLKISTVLLPLTKKIRLPIKYVQLTPPVLILITPNAINIFACRFPQYRKISTGNIHLHQREERR